MRIVSFVPEGWEQYVYWQGQDRKPLKRINALLESAASDPFGGIGKPEPLVGNFSRYWSRWIDEANRLVYRVKDQEIVVVGCRYHYDS